MYKLYSMQRSGNSYKVRLALALLKAPYCAIEVDILRGESRTPDFLAKNPSGQVPLLEVDDGRYLAESNAILWYVAGGTPLAPESRVERAEALQWMFFEQHALEPNIGAAYFWLSLVKGGPILPPANSRSPTSRCTATPMSPTAATSIWQPSPRSAPGCGEWNRPPASSPWTRRREPRSTMPPASPPGPESEPALHIRLNTSSNVKNSGHNVNLCRDLAAFRRRTPQYCRRQL
jgi:hypothetical protein